MRRLTHEAAYPDIRFLPRSRNWWAWLKGTPAECEHLDGEPEWIASLVPDTVYLRGKAARRREPSRPEVSLCRKCLVRVLAAELSSFPGRVVAFEPDAERFSQYFFVEASDFRAAGLLPDICCVLEERLAVKGGACGKCALAPTWLWLSRAEIECLDDAERIHSAFGEHLCAAHGAARLCDALEKISEASLFYMNLPYGEAGAYVWI